MELNREQIIKAFECCYSNNSCDGCPKSSSVDCRRELERDALSLINELTEENKAWQKELISQKEKADKAYYDLACEVEDLRAENERLRDTAYRLECEVHRERANTVRKMQERIGEYFVEHNEIKYGGGLVHKLIDQVAKEMLEGTK